MADELSPQIVAALAHNHYDRRWLDFGVLTVEQVLEQANIPWNAPDDPHTEHVRLHALSDFLAVNHALTDEQVDRLLILCHIDPDASFADSMRIELLNHAGLTDAQFERVAGLPELATWQKQIWRARLTRRLARGEWSPELTELCIGRQDSFVQRALLDHPRLDRPALLALAERGANKPIRNRAAFLLATPRFRSAPGAGPAVAR